MIKAYKLVTLVFICFSVENRISFGQDTLFFKGSDSLLVKVIEVNRIDLGYRKWDYQDGPMYKVALVEISKIHYQNGTKEYYINPIKNSISGKTSDSAINTNLQKLTFVDGEMDARKFYRGYTSAGTVSLISGFVLNIFGLPVPIVTSITPSENAYKYCPKIEALRVNTAYRAGYQRRANAMKTNKVWENYGIGVAAGFGTVIGLALIVVASVL
jgi:hypothetical protein